MVWGTLLAVRGKDSLPAQLVARAQTSPRAGSPALLLHPPATACTAAACPVSSWL